MPGVRGEYSSKYSQQDLKDAINKVLAKGWTIYKASKLHHVPFNTLKRYLEISPGPNDVPDVKKGRPMVLTAEEEQQLVSYTIQMQDLGFGLTATDVRKQAY